jgi:hypothetical protein
VAVPTQDSQVLQSVISSVAVLVLELENERFAVPERLLSTLLADVLLEASLDELSLEGLTVAPRTVLDKDVVERYDSFGGPGQYALLACRLGLSGRLHTQVFTQASEGIEPHAGDRLLEAPEGCAHRGRRSNDIEDAGIELFGSMEHRGRRTERTRGRDDTMPGAGFIHVLVVVVIVRQS